MKTFAENSYTRSIVYQRAFACTFFLNDEQMDNSVMEIITK